MYSTIHYMQQAYIATLAMYLLVFNSAHLSMYISYIGLYIR